ncbi:MAG: hypothetical protein U0R51_00910 [Solirubrobacterales bacterium]
MEGRGQHAGRWVSSILAAVCVAASLVGASAAAAVEYSAPVSYSEGGYPAIAAGPSGQVRFAWEGLFPGSDFEGGIVTAELGDSGAFSDASPVAADVPLVPGPERSVWGPQLATNGAGWTCIAFSIYAGQGSSAKFDAGVVTVAPDGTVGPEVDLQPAGGLGSWQLQRTPADGFVVLWTSMPGGDLRSAEITPDGEVGASRTVVEARGSEVLVPLGLADVGGHSRVVWSDRETRRVGSAPLDGSASRTEVLSPRSFADGPMPVVSGSRIYAFDRRSDGAFELFSARADGERRAETYFRTRPAAYPTSLRIGEGSGHRVAVWDAAGGDVRAAALDPADRARPRTLTPGPARGKASRIAVDSHGRATVIWRKITRDGYVFEGVAAKLDRRGRPGPVTNFSRRTGITRQLDVVIDARDRAVISWNHYGGDPTANSYVREIKGP